MKREIAVEPAPGAREGAARADGRSAHRIQLRSSPGKSLRRPGSAAGEVRGPSAPRAERRSGAIPTNCAKLCQPERPGHGDGLGAGSGPAGQRDACCTRCSQGCCSSLPASGPSSFHSSPRCVVRSQLRGKGQQQQVPLGAAATVSPVTWRPA
ncbi:hypothetical protein NDU88_000368 [Pleurodeles waltl]|uniref:Uncharacterized protein n=1 Tax=Pleurodeles waltl TaxID=8319 RepID=A0AAV7URM9_PLEWA|nr:hypothetical protein NDU88_000368 [Pleurodeles waltl]